MAQSKSGGSGKSTSGPPTAGLTAAQTAALGGKKKAKPTYPQMGVQRDANGNPILDANGNYKPLPINPLGRTTAQQFPLGISDSGKANTEFPNYEYQQVPGSAALFGIAQTGAPVGTPTGGHGLGQDKANPFSISIGGTRHASMVYRGVDLNPDDAMARFTTLDSTARASIQYQLYVGGFYAKGKRFTPGGPVTQDDRDAFAKLLRNSIRTNQPADQLLSSAAATAKATGISTSTSTGSNAIRPINVANADTLNLTLEDAFTKALGRAPTASEKATFIASYHAAQIAHANASGLNDDGSAVTADGSPVTAGSAAAQSPYQIRDVSTNGLPGVDSTIAPIGVTANPALATPANTINNPIVQSVASPTDAATAMARAADPTGYAAHSVGERAQEFYSALIGSAGNSISTTKAAF